MSNQEEHPLREHVLMSFIPSSGRRAGCLRGGCWRGFFGCEKETCVACKWLQGFIHGPAKILLASSRTGIFASFILLLRSPSCISFKHQPAANPLLSWCLSFPFSARFAPSPLPHKGTHCDASSAVGSRCPINTSNKRHGEKPLHFTTP